MYTPTWNSVQSCPLRGLLTIVYFLPKSYIAKLSITIKIFTFPLCEPLEFRLILLVLVLRPDGNLSYLFIYLKTAGFLAPIVTMSGPCPSSIVIQRGWNILFFLIYIWSRDRARKSCNVHFKSNIRKQEKFQQIPIRFWSIENQFKQAEFYLHILS